MRNGFVRLFVLFLIATPFGFAQVQPQSTPQSTSHDEAVVRETYAKVAYAVELRTIHTLLDKNPNMDAAAFAKELAAKEMHFTLTNLSGGSVQAIWNRSYKDLVTKPAGIVLSIGPDRYTVAQDEEPTQVSELNADAKWQQGANLEEQWDRPLKEFMAMSKAVNYKRYVALTVTVSYLERTRTYNALWLFDGPDPVLPVDLVTGNNILFSLYSQEVVPSTLLQIKSLASDPGVRQWLQTHQLPDTACQGSKESACCLPETMRCGVTASAVSRALTKYAVRLKKEAQTGALIHPTPQVIGSCDYYNKIYPAVPLGDVNTIGHAAGGGAHRIAGFFTPSCTYFDPDLPTDRRCGVTARILAHADKPTDDSLGVQGYPFNCHVPNFGSIDGTAAIGQTPTASAQVVEGVTNCGGCLCNLGVNIPAIGIASFTQNVFYSKTFNASITCPLQMKNTPIILDTDGHGYHLTSAEGGVMFDIKGDGHPVFLSWTSPGSTNAFLALDRNNNGLIDDGRELFGNHTAQPQSSDPNGFLALAVFDSAANGGNGDGVIDNRDAVWPQLVLWRDDNHDGKSQKGELFGLDTLGVHRLSLKYRQSRYTDLNGNQFFYRAKVNPGIHNEDDPAGRNAYDVILVQAK